MCECDETILAPPDSPIACYEMFPSLPLMKCARLILGLPITCYEMFLFDLISVKCAATKSFHEFRSPVPACGINEDSRQRTCLTVCYYCRFSRVPSVKTTEVISLPVFSSTNFKVSLFL
ncbi:hypothetical protein TNCV_2028241 [Trichonephila clavipes]|nr:hypothetical protein TNCV_2028241 [Trichonephila clavipes]